MEFTQGVCLRVLGSHRGVSCTYVRASKYYSTNTLTVLGGYGTFSQPNTCAAASRPIILVALAYSLHFVSFLPVFLKYGIAVIIAVRCFALGALYWPNFLREAGFLKLTMYEWMEMSSAQASVPSAQAKGEIEAAAIGINLSLNHDLSRCRGGPHIVILSAGEESRSPSCEIFAGAEDDKRLLFRMTSKRISSGRCPSQDPCVTNE